MSNNLISLLRLMVLAVAATCLIGTSAMAAECKNRGDLDSRYCDDNGDLVADTPTDTSKQLDPDTLIFSYTPVEDPSVYANVFTEFMDYLSNKTGKKVKWYGAGNGHRTRYSRLARPLPALNNKGGVPCRIISFLYYA